MENTLELKFLECGTLFKMKILITGGAGFIGSNVVDALIKKRYKVVVVDNLTGGNKNNINSKAIFYKRNINDNINYVFEVEKPDIVIHMAAQVQLRKSIIDPVGDAYNNIIGTINVLEACRKNGVKKIIYTSTGGARVGEPEYLPVDEKHALNPCSPYGLSKHSAEHYIWAYNKLYGLDYLIFCFGNAYGQRDDPNTKRLIPLVIDKMEKNEDVIIFGDGYQTRDFIYVKDIVSLIANNIDSCPKNKLFHIAGGKQTSINKVVNIIQQLTSSKSKIIHKAKVAGEVRDIVLNTSLVKRQLKWKPEYSIEDGIYETIKYEEKRLK